MVREVAQVTDSWAIENLAVLPDADPHRFFELMLLYKSGNFDGSFNVTDHRSHFILGVIQKKLNEHVAPGGKNVLFVLAGKTDSVSVLCPGLYRLIIRTARRPWTLPYMLATPTPPVV